MKHQSIRTASGKKVHLFSWQSFTVSEVLMALSPVTKRQKLSKILPWILVVLLAVGLGISGYYNWQQHKALDLYDYDLGQCQANYSDLESKYWDVRDENNRNSDEAYRLKDENQSLRSVNSAYYELVVNTYNELNNVEVGAQNVRSDAYDLYYDREWNDKVPAAYDLEQISDDSEWIADRINQIQETINEFLQ